MKSSIDKNLPGNPTNIHIVMIEDEQQIRRFVRAALEGEGCMVFEADSVARGLIEAATRKPELLVVDLGLPDGDGINLVRDFRGWSSAPVLVLSARSQEEQKVAALDAGADDYLTKPFGVAELLARVRALLRRAVQMPGKSDPVMRFGEVEVNLSKRLVTRAGEAVHLTPIEYRLLSLLIANVGRVLTHRQILAEIWGPNHTEHNHYLRVYMAGLRRKLEVDPNFPRHILTESGVGYRLLDTS